MWELIRENKRKSWIIFIGMGICLISLGYLIGAVWFSPDGGIGGIFFALCVWVVLSLVSYCSGDSILLFSSKAKEVSRDVCPQLFNVVEEMKIAASLEAMPKIYIIDEPALNAFATGRSPQKSAIAVTAGLLSRLNRDELQGVVAHEMSHIINRDVLYVTFAGIMLGSIVLLSEVFLRSMWYSSGRSSRRYRSSSQGGGQAQVIMMLAAIVLAVLAPILARLFYFSLSRRREYLADASAVRLDRYPQGLASALEKISNANFDLTSANKITAPMYIANPLKKRGLEKLNLFSTHPPIKERIKILRSMAQGVNYINYLEAFSRVKGKTSDIMPPSALEDSKDVPIRKPFVEQDKKQSIKEKTREIGDLMRAVNNYAFLICLCGLRIKVPPDFKKQAISCPRCARKLEIPLAKVETVTAASGAAIIQKSDKEKRFAQGAESGVYVRKGKGWESFSCSCGKVLQISPIFAARYTTCDRCGRKTEIKTD
ncbi:MAG: M48 family metallopeptidase [Candidatus Omnitrophica bacterium]|nr:M48 family metallopeptidase [Candidatus Omnitrophota bacterium]MBU0878866.1 M48 family metallopeptidase [Candidatus Omnitrophota bacterium]MBU1811041.1 M48 family metallopeptidase [Candidatus Omnitrophota bacterium]